MLTMRSEQMAALEESQRHQFALEMVQHLRGFAPVHAQRLSDKVLYQLARTGLVRAEKYQLTLRGPVRLYIELMVLLGSNFDTDPQYPWAATLLNECPCIDEMERAERLQQRSLDFYDRVLGANYEHEHAAIRRLREKDFEQLPQQDAQLREELMGRLTAIYPQKVDYVGRLPLAALMSHATSFAESCILPAPAGPALLMGIMFALGHGCGVDPQFPWLANALADAQRLEPPQRVPRIRGEFLAYLRSGPAASKAES